MYEPYIVVAVVIACVFLAGFEFGRWAERRGEP